MSEYGFIAIGRGLFAHDFWTAKRTFSFAEAWIDLIQMARWDEGSMLFKSNLVQVERGQIITAERFLSTRWGWSRSKLRSFLDLLKKDQMIDHKKTAQKTTITLCNYDRYNAPQTSEKTTKEPQKDRKKTTKRPNKNKYNNYNKDNTTSTLMGVGMADGEIAASTDPDPLESAFAEFQKWIKEHAPRVAQMKEPFTIAQYQSVKTKFSSKQVADTLRSMHNYEPLLVKNRSANLTFRKWAEKDKQRNEAK